jgi:putative Holliday junction resolvase
LKNNNLNEQKPEKVLPGTDSAWGSAKGTEVGHIIQAVDFDQNDPLPDDGGKRELPVGRILGLDVGARRIGVAVSDPLGITAQGLETLQRRNKRQDLEYLQRVIQEYDVREIVVGLPLRMSGAEGTQSDKMQTFAEDLRKRFRLPVHLWDERLTSAEANRLLRETDLSIEKRGKAVDRMAAVLILQGWMEERAARASGFRLPASGSE